MISFFNNFEFLKSRNSVKGRPFLVFPGISLSIFFLTYPSTVQEKEGRLIAKTIKMDDSLANQSQLLH